MKKATDIKINGQTGNLLTTIYHKQVNPEGAQRTAVVGSIAVGLTVQALSKRGWEGSVYGAGAGITGLLTLVSLLSISVTLPVLIVVGAIGGFLGGMSKAATAPSGLRDSD